jgi:primary-amine oxidase
VGSKRLLNNANWARYNLAVSVRKENEPSSSSMFNMNLPGKPVVVSLTLFSSISYIVAECSSLQDFHKFFNGENMTQTDLVAWINVGTHHLPQAEDSPNTRTNTAASSFFLTPLNYFDSDVSMDSLNAVLLSHPKLAGDAFEFTEYGVQQAHCVPRAPEPFKYEGMKAYGVDGRVKPQQATEELRKEAELFHRIKIEL